MRGHKLHGHWTLVRMKGRGDGKREDPWLLITARDEFVRPASEFSVVDEMPDSVKEMEDRPKAAAAAARTATASSAAAPTSGPPTGARKAALPKELQPELA